MHIYGQQLTYNYSSLPPFLYPYEQQLMFNYYGNYMFYDIR